jgi:outer membrane protein assembly factor BamB
MGVVYEMNGTSGALRWKTPVGDHNGHDNDSLNALNGKKLKLPLTYVPGALGGILTNMAVAGNTLYVATCNLPFRFTHTQSVNGSPVGTTISGDIEALNVTTGKVEWSTAVRSLPLGATTVVNNVVFTTLVSGELLALNTTTGAIIFTQKLPRATTSPLAVAGNTVIVPVGGPVRGKGAPSQIIAYRLP